MAQPHGGPSPGRDARDPREAGWNVVGRGGPAPGRPEPVKLSSPSEEERRRRIEWMRERRRREEAKARVEAERREVRRGGRECVWGWGLWVWGLQGTE